MGHNKIGSHQNGTPSTWFVALTSKVVFCKLIKKLSGQPAATGCMSFDETCPELRLDDAEVFDYIVYRVGDI